MAAALAAAQPGDTMSVVGNSNVASPIALRGLSPTQRQHSAVSVIEDDSISLASAFINEKDVQGILHVTIVSGEHLPRNKFENFVDPYVCVYVQRSKQKTKAIKQSVSPVWQHAMAFKITNLATAACEIVIKDYQFLGRNHVLERFPPINVRDIGEVTEFRSLQLSTRGVLNITLRYEPVTRTQDFLDAASIARGGSVHGGTIARDTSTRG
jgi:hypothetical protein